MPAVHMLSSSRALRAAPWLWALLLNCSLFVPAYVCSTPEASFWPADVVHGQVFARANQDVFRVSIDFACMLLCLSWSQSAWLRRGLMTAYGTLWIFLAYHHGVAYWFQRTPALLEDVRLGLNLLHFLGSFAHSSWQRDLAIFAVVCVGLWLTARCFAALQHRAAEVKPRTRVLLSLAIALPCVSSLAWFGAASDAPVLQLASKRVYYNIQSARTEAQQMAAVQRAAPDRRYDAYTNVHLVRKPDFYLMMMEAYGEILATWDMAPAYRALLARVEKRMASAGYHAASTYSRAPVHSGTSWFSIGSVHTGVLIHRPKAYALFQEHSAQVPTLTRFFRSQGYRSYALQPGSTQRTGLTRSDVFEHDVFVDAITLAYTGKKYGFGRVPDQYALGAFRERYLEPSADPRYVFFMNVSTHYPWGDDVPPYVRDWKTLGHAEAPEGSDVDATWPEIPYSTEIGTPLRRSYFRSIAYAWRLLTEWFEAEAHKDSVIVVLGDHQPRLERNLPGEVTLNTPLHVFAKDPAFIQALVAQHGFEPGLYAIPNDKRQLRHEGLFSLLVSQLTASFGPRDAPRLPIHPNGAPLAALKR